MRHEDYLVRLIQGFAGDPRQPEPAYTGSSVADAIARWIAFTVAGYAMDSCGFTPTESRRTLIDVVDARTTRRWATDQCEDVNLTIRGLTQGGDVVSHAMRITAQPHHDRCVVRIRDLGTRHVIDVEGTVGKRDGRWIITDDGYPLVWRDRPGARRTRVSSPPLEPCCRDTLRRIARLDESMGHLADAIDGLDTWDSLGLLDDPFNVTNHTSSPTGRVPGSYNALARANIQDLIRIERDLNHPDSLDPVHMRWRRLGQSYAH